MAGTRGYKDMIHVKLLNVLLKVIINMGVGDWIYASINVSKYYATHISSMHNYVKDYRYSICMLYKPRYAPILQDETPTRYT